MNEKMSDVAEGIIELCQTYATKYSKMNQGKFFKVFIPQILLGPFLNTLPHTWWEIFAMWKLFILFLCPTHVILTAAPLEFD